MILVAGTGMYQGGCQRVDAAHSEKLLLIKD